MSDRWPELPFEPWKDTVATLHMWTQIVGKIRLAQSPWVNHSWHVTLYVTPRGLTTGSIPYGEESFQIDFDFIDHRLRFASSDGGVRAIPLRPQTTADFHAAVKKSLDELGLNVKFHGRPNEIADAIPFAEDRVHASYDAAAVHRFWRVLVQVDRVFHQFRARFLGKCSPVQFFWGSFDLAVTRFSGRTAPEHPGGFPNMPNPVMREAYSHEVSSAGFWPGSEAAPLPMFYSYAYPSPERFGDSQVRPAAAMWNGDFGQFALPYDVVRTAESPDDTLLEFLESTYDAAARLAKWDMKALQSTFHAS